MKFFFQGINKFLLIFVVFSVLIMSGIFSVRLAYAGTLTTSITDATTCTGGGGTVLLRMSGATNAHAELPGQTNYSTSVVCGNGVAGLGTSCTGTFATMVKLSGATNAHIEDKSLSNYANSACISVSSGSVSTGTTTATCVGAGYDATIGSMSGNTNAHIGDSTAYTTKICATATGSNPPTLTTYTNSTETGLNYAASCTGCGARIGGGAGFRQMVVITGTNFGADPGAGNRSTASNNVKVGAQQIADTNVTAWSTTSITFLTDSNVAGDADSDWGADFGGASALTVTAGGSTSGGLNFYVFPQVTSITTCDKAGFPTGNGGREYDATDSACPNGLKDGQIKLNGTRFGTAATGGYTRILGCDSSTCASPTGTVNIDSWSNTLIQAQVPPIISNSVYTGSLIMQQGTGSNNKTHTYTTTGFRVFPRIASPSSASVGDPITINGDHLCQNGGVCPGSFGISDDIVVFTSYATSTVFTSWNNTAIVTAVPTGTVTGNVVVTSNMRDSNGASFTVISLTPSDPTSLGQFKNIGLTQAISIGGIASSTPIYLSMTMQAGVSGGTLYPQIEYKAIGTGFACTGTSACGSATEGIGWAGPGPTTGTTSVTAADGVYHWQARVRHNKNSIDYYSNNWVSFDNGNPESSTDFKIDTTAPAITNISSGSPGTNSATITWDTTAELSTSQIQYNTTGTFVNNCATNNDCTTLADTPPETNGKMAGHSVSLSNLNSGTTYYYRARSKDEAGNESISSNSSFITSSVSQPSKTTKFHIQGLVGTVSGVATTTTFSIFMPENATSTKNIFIQIKGIYTSGAASKDVAAQFNSESSRTYIIPASSTSFFKILHPVQAIAVDPATNTLTITPQTNTTLNILSADIVVQYAYTP